MILIKLKIFIMPINEQKIILNLKNNLEHKPITASDLPGVNRIGLLPDETLHFEYDPITAYGKRPDMIDNTIGMPTKGIRDKALNGLGLGLAGVMTLPLLAYGAEAATAGEIASAGSTLWNGTRNYGNKLISYGRNLLQNGITNQYARDILIGSTIGLTADAAVKTFTPYNGVADGMLRSTFGEDIQQNPYYDYMLFGAEFFNPVNLIAPASIASKTGLYRQFDNLGNEIDMFGRLQQSKKAINDYSKFKKNNPGVSVVHDITSEDVKLRFEDPEVTQVVDEVHDVVWTKNENGFLINNRPVDIDKVQVLDDVSLNGVDDSWLQDLSNTMEPGTVMLTGRIKDLRLNGNRVEPWFGFIPRYNYNSSYNARAERFLDEAIESASRNKDLESYVESLRNLRNKISNHQFDSWNNVIFADNSNNIRFSTYGNDMRIDLPSIVYRNGVWDHPELKPLSRENLDPNNVLGLFDRYPFRRTIVDPYHRVHYTRDNGKYYIHGLGWSQPFNPENVSVAPQIDFTQTGRDKLEAYLRSVDSPDRIVLTGNVSGAHYPFNLSETPLSKFVPQRTDNYYRMERILPSRSKPIQFEPYRTSNFPYLWIPSSNITSSKAPFITPAGHQRSRRSLGIPSSNILHQEFDIPEVDPKLRDNFINFVESYPGEKFPIYDREKLELLRNIYESFGLGRLPDDIIEKARRIAENSADEAARIAPEISLVDQHPSRYDLVYYRNGRPVGSLSTSYRDYTNTFGDNFKASHINMIQSLNPDEKGVARSLYSSGLIYDDLFYKQIYPNAGGGLISGEVLLSPEQTIHTILKPNFSTRLFGNYGIHHFNNGRDVRRRGRLLTKRNAPVYHVTSTTDRIPVKSRNILHPHRIEFKDGKFSLIPLDLSNPSLYKSIVPIVGVGAGAATLSGNDNQ